MAEMLSDSYPSRTLASRLYSLVIGHEGYDDEPVAADTRLMLVDTVGVALAAWHEVTPVLVRRAVLAERLDLPASERQATVWGSVDAANGLDAALANGVAAHALDYDAVVPSAYVQPAAVLVACLIALGERFQCPPARVMAALARGLRLLTLLGRQWGGTLHDLGWHPSSILGPVAGAAAGCYLRDLDPGRAVHALGAAASLASGVKVNFGTPAKHLQVGEAARQGVLATLFASGDGTANPRALEAWLGQLLGRTVDAEVPELDSVVDLQIKKYPSCGRMHAAIDACLAMRPAVPVQRVDSIEIGLNPVDIGHIDRQYVSTADEARFSIQYCVAAALLDNELTLRQFTDDRIKSADVTQLMRQVALVVNPSVPSFGTRVRISSGSDPAEKYMARPEQATEDEVLRKFLACCAVAGVSEKSADELSNVLMHLDDAPTMATLSSCLRQVTLVPEL